MLMLHGVAFFNAQQQSGPRGADKVFSTNWFMPMAQRKLDVERFTARTMLSFEPATVTGATTRNSFSRARPLTASRSSTVSTRTIL